MRKSQTPKSPEKSTLQHEKWKDMGTPLCWSAARAPLPDQSWMVAVGSRKREQAVITAESRCSEPWKARAAGKPGTCLAAAQIPRQQQHGRSASQRVMPGSNEWGPQKKPINQHGCDQAHQSVRSAYCQRNAWPQIVVSIEYDPVCIRKQEMRNHAAPASLPLPFENTGQFHINYEDRHLKGRYFPQGSFELSAQRRGTAVRSSPEEGPAMRSVGRHSSPGARALPAHLPSIWERARQGGDHCSERWQREKLGTTIGFATSEAALIWEKFKYNTCKWGFFSLLTLLILLAFHDSRVPCKHISSFSQ